MHIAKTAGTSLIAILDQRFTVNEICPLDRATRGQFLESFSEDERHSYKFIRGHFPYSVKDDLKSPRLITFLRDPVERTLSEISHLKRMELQGLKYIDESIKDLSLEAFIKHPIVGSHVVNRTTKYLNDFKSVITVVVPPEPKPDLNLAKQRLETFHFIGITERFSDSLELLSYIFGFPAINNFPILQVSPNREKRQDIPQNIIDQIEEMNRDEIELYQFGLKIFEEQLDRMKVEKRSQKPYDPSIKYKPTVEINFNRVDPGQGWYTGESNPKYGTIRWSGPETESRLYLPLDPGRDLMIRFRILQSVSPDVLESLVLEVNGHRIELAKRPEGNQGAMILEGLIPRAAIKHENDLSALIFRVGKTHRPGEFNPRNTDVRQLGLCYNWLHIYPA